MFGQPELSCLLLRTTYLGSVCRLLHSTAPSGARSKLTWGRCNLNPKEAGMQTNYRRSHPTLTKPCPLSKRATSVADGGGSGRAGVLSYLQPRPVNVRYNPRLYQGGLLPRLENCDEPVRLPEHQPLDVWSPHRAHFGQNDYIDILGDGTLSPIDFYTGPPWALGARNEFQRVAGRLNNPALVAWMEEFEPSRLKREEKLHRFLFKRMNKRKNIKFLRYRDSP